jgi:hypothetical protein
MVKITDELVKKHNVLENRVEIKFIINREKLIAENEKNI